MHSSPAIPVTHVLVTWLPAPPHPGALSLGYAWPGMPQMTHRSPIRNRFTTSPHLFLASLQPSVLEVFLARKVEKGDVLGQGSSSRPVGSSCVEAVISPGLTSPSSSHLPGHSMQINAKSQS